MPTVTSSCARSPLRLRWSARADAASKAPRCVAAMPPTGKRCRWCPGHGGQSTFPRSHGTWQGKWTTGVENDMVKPLGTWGIPYDLGNLRLELLQVGVDRTHNLCSSVGKDRIQERFGAYFCRLHFGGKPVTKKTQFWSSQWHLMTSSQRNSWPVLVSPYFSWIMTSTARSEIKIIMILYQWYHGRRKQLIFHMILASHFCSDKKTRIICHPMIPWGFYGVFQWSQGLPRLCRAFLRDPSLVGWGSRWRRRRTGTAGTLRADPNGRGGPLGRQKTRFFWGDLKHTLW